MQSFIPKENLRNQYIQWVLLQEGSMVLMTCFKIQTENEYLNCEKNRPLHYIYITRPAMSPVLAQSLRCYLNLTFTYKNHCIHNPLCSTLRMKLQEKMKFYVHCQDRASILTAHIYRILYSLIVADRVCSTVICFDANINEPYCWALVSLCGLFLWTWEPIVRFISHVPFPAIQNHC